MTPAAIVLVIVASLMIVEARRAAANEHLQRAAGGVEPPDDVYQVMRVAYPAIFIVMASEGFVRQAPADDAAFVIGVSVFLLAKVLKWWAIQSLGDFWTFRVIVVPGSRPVVSGPYRFLRHPNYVAVVGEIAGVALMMRALITGPLAAVFFGTLLARRIAVENRARDAILRRR